MGKSAPKAPAEEFLLNAVAHYNLHDVAAAEQSAALNRVSEDSPYGNVVYSQPDPNNPNLWTQQQQLSPQGAALFDLQARAQQGLGYDVLSQLTSANPSLTTAINPSAYTPYTTGALTGLAGVNPAGNAPLTSFTPATAGGIGALQSAYANLTPLNTNYQDIHDQAYKSQMAMVQPQLDLQKKTMESTLTNQGITEGSDAWNAAQRQFQVTQQTPAEQSAIVNATNQAGAAIQQSIALQQTPLQEAATYAGAVTPAATAATQQEIATGQYPLSQALSYATGVGNLTGQDISQAIQMQNQPLNLVSAMMSGAQVQQPQFGAVPQTGQVQAPNVIGAYTLQQQAEQQAYQAALQQYYGGLGGMGSLAGTLGGSAMMAPSGGWLSNWFSDERLKTDIAQIGELKQPGGETVPIHTFRFKGSPIRHVGLIAQHVKDVNPEAVMEHPSTGLLGVNYAKVLMDAHRARAA